MLVVTIILQDVLYYIKNGGILAAVDANAGKTLKQSRVQGAGHHGALQNQRLRGHGARTGTRAGCCHARPLASRPFARLAHGGVD